MYVVAVDKKIPTVQYGLLNRDYPLHSHQFWELHLFTGGSGHLVQAGAAWAVSVGSMTLSPPGSGHRITVESSLAFYYIQFSAEGEGLGVVRRLMESQEASGPLRVDAPALAEVGRLKERLDSATADRVASGFHRFRAWLYDLAAGGGASPSDGIDRILGWLGQNLDRPLDLDELAAVAGLDRFALCRRFKQRTGLSPLAYVQRSKIEAAGFLLSGTDLSLAEVAQKLGFCDEFHFGKVFKKWRGVSPGRWRRDQVNEAL